MFILAFNPALSRWRQLSAYLRPDWNEDRAYVELRDARIVDVAHIICRTFEPWVMLPGTFEARHVNLVNIMKSAVDTGILLFSQPSTFVFRWVAPPSQGDRRRGKPTTTTEQRQNPRVVVLPGLVKVRDADSRELRTPLELVSPVVGSI